MRNESRLAFIYPDRYSSIYLVVQISHECIFSVMHIYTQKRSTRQTMKPKKVTPASKARDRIIRRAALEFKDGMYGKYDNKNTICMN